MGSFKLSVDAGGVMEISRWRQPPE